MPENIFQIKTHITSLQRAEIKNQKPICLWFTGLSGSGKSTIANLLDKSLYRRGKHTFVLDGDNVRAGINSDCGFSENDRNENIRRAGHVCKLMCDAGLIVIASFISPYNKGRHFIRNDIFKNKNFIEIYINTNIEECKKRDTKKLYLNSLNGKIKDFTGIDSPYEKPINPEIEIDTTTICPDKSVKKITKYLREKNYI